MRYQFSQVDSGQKVRLFRMSLILNYNSNNTLITVRDFVFHAGLSREQVIYRSTF